MIVRFGCGYACLRMRIASIIVMVPVPLSVAPCDPSHESKCADSITYSFGFSVPLIMPKVLNTGTSPSDSASALTRSCGDCLRSVRRKSRP